MMARVGVMMVVMIGLVEEVMGAVSVRREGLLPNTNVHLRGD